MFPPELTPKRNNGVSGEIALQQAATVRRDDSDKQLSVKTRRYA